jgi:excisionase family DNA binding protein
MARPKKRPLARPPSTWEQAPLIMDSSYMSLLLGLHRKTIQRMARQGALPTINTGTKLLFEKNAVMKVLGITM